MVLHYVSTSDEAISAVAELAKESVLSVDCEGVALSRTGQLCLIQVSTAVHPTTRLFHVYLFDIVALGDLTFTTGLGLLLTSPTPTKLFYDVRRDSEALYHQYGIMLAGVCDIQLMEIARRRLRNENINYLPGLARLLAERCDDLDTDLQRIKDGMSGKYADEPDLWRKRPLTREQNIYAAIDVALLHILLAEITTPQAAPEKKRGKTDATEADKKSEEEEAKNAEDEAMAVAMEKITGGAAAASSASAPSPSPSKGGRGSAAARRAAIFVNAHTQSIIEQYSDVVWAASIRYE